jgi:hypothetical protein
LQLEEKLRLLYIFDRRKWIGSIEREQTRRRRRGMDLRKMGKNAKIHDRRENGVSRWK